MESPNRKNIRLGNYNYSQSSIYFITICTHNRMKVLSKIVGCGFHATPLIKLTSIGNCIEETIQYINEHYINVTIDKYVIIPNHIHLLVNVDSGGCGNPPLPSVIGQLKSDTTKLFNDIEQTNNLILWQRNYHNHIIREECDYQNVWNYIDTNPLKWQEDKYYK